MNLKSIGLLFFLLIRLISAAPAQISVQLIQPNEFALSTRDLWNCILVNASNTTPKVYLHGTITELKDGKIFEVNSADFGLSTGTTQFNTTNYAALIPEKILFKSPLYEDYLLRTNALPRGEYKFCIEVVAVEQQNILASFCLNIEVKTSTPPFIISPNYGDTICEPNPFFIWAPPQPPLSGPDVSYEVLMYEVQGQQNAVSASLNNPLWYKAANLSSPVYQYGIDARPLVALKTYAWYVRALEGKTEVSRSEIGSFIWNSCADSGADVPSSEPSSTLQKRLRGVHYYALPEFEQSEPVSVKNVALHITYLSQANTEVLIQLLDQQGKLIYQKPVQMQVGYNYLSLLPQEWKFIRQQYHHLIITDPYGKKQSLRFWYKP